MNTDLSGVMKSAELYDRSTAPYGQIVYLSISVGCGPKEAYLSMTTEEDTESIRFKIGSNQPVILQVKGWDGIYMAGLTGPIAEQSIRHLLAGGQFYVRRQGLSAVNMTMHEFSIPPQSSAIRNAVESCMQI
ncbi:MAG: hypothetical protein NXI15_05545 [Gammaproteobacteria bacterium]|nr:hypothetical protein [Gammaproteobacteria bacterium]